MTDTHDSTLDDLLKDESDTDVTEADEKPETVDVDLYLASHGKVPRTGGPYSDDLAREEAEKWRAKAEGREPDYDNLPMTAGDRLVPKQYLRETDTDKSHFSDAVEVTNEPVETVKVELPVSKVDPTQVAWDNDQSKINALYAKKVLDEAGYPDPTEGYMPDSVRGQAATTPENVNKKKSDEEVE